MGVISLIWPAYSAVMAGIFAAIRRGYCILAHKIC